MSVTDTKYKAMADNSQIAMQEPALEGQDHTAKVLLDECVQGIRRADVEAESDGKTLFVRSVDILGIGAKDDALLQFLLNSDFELFASRDHELICRCFEHNVPVAYSQNDKAYVLKLDRVLDQNSIPLVFFAYGKAYVAKVENTIKLPIHKTEGAPFKFKGKPAPIKEPSLWAKLARLFR